MYFILFSFCLCCCWQDGHLISHSFPSIVKLSLLPDFFQDFLSSGITITPILQFLKISYSSWMFCSAVGCFFSLHSLFLFACMFGNFYRPSLQFTDSFLGPAKSTDEPVESIFHFSLDYFLKFLPLPVHTFLEFPSLFLLPILSCML